MIHKNLDNVLSIKDELLKVISDLEWSKWMIQKID
jgi:hypothetical protein